MPKLTITISTIKDPSKVSQMANTSLENQIVGNKAVRSTKGKSDSTIKVRQVNQKLVSSGLTPLQRDSATTSQISEDLLATLGCTSITDEPINKADFSLLSIQMDKEVVDNPNKLDSENFKEIRKVNVSLEGILKSDNDAIYYLDEDISDNYKNEKDRSKKKVEPNLTNVASRMIDINYGNRNGISPTLRGLKMKKQNDNI
jgi:hypothetical protein